jgi:ribosomal protein S7
MRKTRAKKLPLAPDPKFNDTLVTRFVNNVMWQGKKGASLTIFYDSLEKVSKMTGEDGYEIWRKALSNVTPAVVVQPSRFLLKFVPIEKFLSASSGWCVLRESAMAAAWQTSLPMRL